MYTAHKLNLSFYHNTVLQCIANLRVLLKAENKWRLPVRSTTELQMQMLFIRVT